MSYSTCTDCDCVVEEMKSSIQQMRNVLGEIFKHYHNKDINQLKVIYKNNINIVNCLEYYLEESNQDNDLKDMFSEIRNMVNSS
jgi:hypothetical protein